jgi:DNA-binding CsgD family transcriptional regulator
MNQRKILDLIELIYAAATEPTVFPHLLSEIAKAIDAHSANSVQANASAVNDNYYYAYGSPVPVFGAYQEYYYQHDLWHQASLSFEKNPPTILKGEELVDPAVFKRSEFFNDFLKPLDIQRFVGFVIRPDPISGKSGMSTHFGFYRSVGAAPFGQDQIQILELLIPHLRRACSIQMKLAEAHSLRQADTEILNRLPIGVVLFDRNGRAIFLNRIAETLARQGDGFHVDITGRCRAEFPADTQALRKLIADVTDGANGGPHRRGGDLMLARRRSPEPLSVSVAPLSGDTVPLLDHAPGAVLFLVDPDGRMESIEEFLTRRYGLSIAEARLAAALAGGSSVNEYAEARGTTLNTVRTQLKQVLAKTGARRQAELVGRVLCGSAFLGMMKGGEDS